MSAFVNATGFHAWKTKFTSAPLLARDSRPFPISRCTPGRRVRVVARLDQDDVPPEIKELNKREVERRASIEAEKDPPNSLTEQELATLFLKYPEVGAFYEKLEKDFQDFQDLGVDMNEIYSYIYRALKPRTLSYPLIALIAFSSAAVVARAVVEIRRRYTPQAIALVVATADFYVGLFVLAICGFALLGWTLARESEHSDAPRRLCLSTMATSSLLSCSTALCATGFLDSGLWTGAAIRLVVLPLSLWLWTDLNDEVHEMSMFAEIPHAIAFRWWRLLVTIFVLVGGGLLRLVAVANPRSFPIRDVLVNRASDLRLLLGSQFPVAMSLLMDPGGTAFLAALVLALALIYVLYVIIFLADILRNRQHRKSKSPLSKYLISKNIYLPDVLPDIKSILSTGPEDEEPFYPSPAMMLTDGNEMIAFDSTVSLAKVPPILQMLEEEREVMKRKGMKRWLPPRNEFIPVRNKDEELQRMRDSLRNWSRPLSDEEKSRSFSEFFQYLTDEEDFEYDPKSEDWVYSKPENANDGPIELPAGAGEMEDSSDNGSDKFTIRFEDLDDPDVGTVV